MISISFKFCRNVFVDDVNNTRNSRVSVPAGTTTILKFVIQQADEVGEQVKFLRYHFSTASSIRTDS